MSASSTRVQRRRSAPGKRHGARQLQNFFTIKRFSSWPFVDKPGFALSIPVQADVTAYQRGHGPSQSA